MNIFTKRADASTLSVVHRVKANLPKFQSVVPADVKVSYEFDQSPYVTRAIAGLTMEGALGAFLAGLVVFLFLRDWRSALVVVLNIPLALLGAVAALWITGQTVKMSEVSRSLVAATSSSRFVVPNYWADPNSGVAYQIQVQIPQTNMNSLEAAQNLPVGYRDGKAILLRNLASVKEGTKSFDTSPVRHPSFSPAPSWRCV